MSIGSVLSIARTAMAAQQAAVQTASQNISGANIDGYSKQRVETATNAPLRLSYGSIGTGAHIAGIFRARDTLLDSTYRADAGSSAGAGITNGVLKEVDGILGEPSDTGIGAALDQFFSSWSDLAADPTSAAPRSVVRERGDALAQKLNAAATRLDDLTSRTRDGLSSDVAEINKLTKQIADLNPRIVAAESGGSTANDLRDDRDRAVDQLAKLTGATAVERSNGTVGVYVSGQLIVDADNSQQLTIQGVASPKLAFVSSGQAIEAVGGSVGARIDAITKQIPNVMASLDALAKGLVDSVNAIHSSGTVFSGSPPVGSPAGNFFEVTTNPPASGDPLKTARSIRLASTLTNGSAVAASSGTAAGPGDNGVAAALAGLRDSVTTFTSPDGATNLGTATLNSFYRDTVSTVGSAASAAQDQATAYDTMASNSDKRRQSVSGVSTDEELIELIQHQHSYQAAARLVTIVDDMAQTLINLGR